MTDKTKAQQESWVEKVRQGKEEIDDDKATEEERRRSKFGGVRASQEKTDR